MKVLLTIQCLHPLGKKAPAISIEKYTLLEKAIYHSLQGKKGITFTDLIECIEKDFAKQKTIFKGSVSWYAVHVKNHMETKGIIKTYIEKGRKLHILV